MLNNTFSLLKTLVHQYRAAVPIAPQALLTHLQVLRLHAGSTGPQPRQTLEPPAPVIPRPRNEVHKSRPTSASLVQLCPAGECVSLTPGKPPTAEPSEM